MTFNIDTSSGIWDNSTGEGHVHDQKLSEAIIEFVKSKNIKSVTDLGCGKGDYIKEIKPFVNSVFACDGNPHTPSLTNGIGIVADLSKPQKFSKNDLIISLEVGEHIPKDRENIFLDNITKPAKEWLLTSWAVPGQGGDGHVNCQPNQYIINEIEKRGFKYMLFESELFRIKSSLSWFKNTILLFKKIK